ncbi:hypothetical protein [Salisaeta longa]|uniref:hypothetical protein n=1 Tax=Salisaeta longa TaxID=503170 RepID=UPI0003B5CA59|nr:hypothetical protein [Salisaeta longa]
MSRFLPLCLLLLLVGCRTYGGYGTEQETWQQMQTATEQFATDLTQAKAELARLQAVADTSAALQPMAARYERTVALHQERLNHHQTWVEELKGSDNYRALNRTYGAIITEQRLTTKQYQRTLQNVQAVVRGASPVPSDDDISESTYADAPVHYRRVENQGVLTLTEALSQ